MPLSTDDLVEIQHLYARYNTAIDTGDGDAFSSCFIPAGVFDPGMGLIEGQEAIAEFGTSTHKNMPLMRHNATNIVVEGEGANANGSAFLIGYLAGAEDHWTQRGSGTVCDGTEPVDLLHNGEPAIGMNGTGFGGCTTRSPFSAG